MNSNLKTSLIFITGIIAGSAITTVLVKKKYEEIIDEEIASVKESYEANYPEEGEVIVPENVVNIDKGDISQYSELAAKYKAEELNESDEEDDSPRMNVERVEKPSNPNIYEIYEEEYGEMDTYDLIECTLYSDRILSDDDDGIIDDVEETVGSVNLDTLDEENNLIYIRNESKMVDYAISYDSRDYVTAQRSAHRIH